MHEVATPRGAVKVPARHALQARERLFAMSPEQRRAAEGRARAVLERRDSRRAAAVVAAAAALAALVAPAVAL